MSMTGIAGTQIRVGAGSAEIMFPKEMFPAEGFNGEINDAPHARVLILDGDIRIAIVAIELVVVAKPFVVAIKKIINRINGVNEENIWVHSTHAISTPHAPGPKPIGPPELRRQPTERERVQRELFTESLNSAVEAAAEEASRKMAPARFGYGTGECDVNVSSREQDRERDLIDDIDGLNICDKELTVLKFESLDGRLLGMMLNYCLMSNAIDNSEMDQGSRRVSADVPGRACRILEEKYDAPVLFCMAAGADQRPKQQAYFHILDENGDKVTVDKGVEYGIELVEKYGAELAECAGKITDSITCSRTTPLISSASSSVTVKDRKRKGTKGSDKGESTSELVILAARIGDVCLVATNPELCCATELELKQVSPFDKTLLISFTDGPKGIMADKGSFAKPCGEQNASFAQEGSAEKFVDAAVKVLNII